MEIIIIAGGSGSGKSALAYTLEDHYPNVFEVMNLDDYHKLKTSIGLPMLENKINWDHPGVIQWDKLIKDIALLQNGKPVTINSWSHRSNRDYFKHGKMIPRTMVPKKALIIEGNMVLWNKQIKDLSSRSYFLNLDDETRMRRRNKFIDPDYDSKVLQPMHKMYVVPTMSYADIILNVTKMNQAEVYFNIEHDLKETYTFLQA
ncbi:MAG: uridine kinase family protein [Candidatus Levyibacteriota bacterium]